MTNTRMRHSLLVAAVAWIAALGTVAAAETPQVLPSVKLRGYGAVAGEFSATRLPGGGGSLLQIHCEDVAKARLLHAKYLSDLGLLPGVRAGTLAGPGGPVAYRAIDRQGAIAAVRAGGDVCILTAANAGDLAALLARQFPGPRAALVSEPETEVPMFLDRWDKFGWRFYYRLNEYPPDLPRAERKGYDPMQEMVWADKLGRLGFTFWNTMCRVDTAEGLLNDVWWNYMLDAARAKKLPVGINAVVEPGDSAVWLLNRYREQTQQKMPQFVGDFYKVADQSNGGHGATSWNATEAMDVELGLLQSCVRRLAAESNVVSFLEPHGELGRQSDLWVEYGPVADAGFQRYLQQTHGTPAALGTRWFGDARHFKSWDEVRVPELAEFLGWSAQALDLAGVWRIGYERAPGGKDYTPEQVRAFGENIIPTDPAPAGWFAPGFDDGAWPQIAAPGHDRALFFPQRPAVYRRSFEAPATWTAAHPRTWLYVWDLNRTRKGGVVQAFLNGQSVGASKTTGQPHWAAFEATAALRAGTNHIALRVPQGYLAYRVYLSPEPPVQYPALGPGRNAQWVDFSDWVRWSRIETCRRGVEMIRQVDGDRPITFMHPDEYSDGIKQLAEDYGGEFHNTGYASAFFAEYNTLVMQGAGLPTSLEPGSGAKTLTEFKQFMGRYFTEGIQSVDYFIHVGDILWHTDIRREFEALNPLVRLIGKYHAPRAEAAVLYSTRITHLTDYPWGSDPNVLLPAGYWRYNPGALLRDRYARDGLTESSFAQGDAGRYRVILDSNTSIMDTGLVDAIERYVRDGGTFVTFVQSGRHTPERPDVWPLSRLTGYRVTGISRFAPNGDVPKPGWHTLRLAPAQAVFRADNVKLDLPAHGLSLEKVAPDVQDLLLWDDGSVAAGMRPLGKGWIVEVGPQFTSYHPPDRMDPGSNTREMQAYIALFSALLDWRGVQTLPARLSAEQTPAGPVLLRHWLSNNGLYDVWTLWNQDPQRTLTTDLLFENSACPAACLDVGSGQPLPVTAGPGARVAGIELQPLQTRILLTPRRALENASLAWFELQRTWWRGTRTPSRQPLPAPPHKLSVDLSQDWAWKPLAAGDDVLALAAPGCDDKTWERMPLRVWSLPDRQAITHALFRRAFTVPAPWTRGRIELWVESWAGPTFKDRARLFLDGHLIRDWHQDGLPGAVLDELKPGSTHVLAIEVQSDSKLAGVTGPAWLWYQPRPQTSLDLAGDWLPSNDVQHYAAALRLPGDFNALSLRRTLRVPAGLAGQNAVLDVDATGALIGVLINGHWVRRFHHHYGDRWSLNITPWMRCGGDNEIELVAWGQAGRGTVRSVSLDFYDRGVYP